MAFTQIWLNSYLHPRRAMDALGMEIGGREIESGLAAIGRNLPAAFKPAPGMTPGIQNQTRNAPSLVGRNKWGETYLQWLRREMNERNRTPSPPSSSPPKRGRGTAPGEVAREEAKKKKKAFQTKFWQRRKS